MSIFEAFPTPIYTSKITNKSIHDNIGVKVDWIKKNLDLTNPWFDNTKTSFKNSIHERSINKHFNDVEGFVEEVKHHCAEYMKTLAKFDFCPFDFDVYESWVNYSNNGDYQHTHIHPTSDISGCYYYKSKGVTPIQFTNPNNTFNYASFPKHFCMLPDTASLAPKEGTILLFPSWLQHTVLENKQEDERISVTFNVRIIEPNDKN